MRFLELLEEFEQMETPQPLEPPDKSSLEAQHRQQSFKQKVKIYPSISKALATLEYGQTFSTIGSERVYVVTRPSFGLLSHQNGEKVAKGFAVGTPPEIIRGYSARTGTKHGTEFTG